MAAFQIVNGAVATVIFKINVTNQAFLATADSVIAAIGQELIGDGLTIGPTSIDVSGIFFALSGEFSGSMQIVNQSGQELDDTDLISQLNDAVIQVGGQLVSAGVTQVSGTPSGQNSHTGSQGNITVTPLGQMNPDTSSAPPVHQCGDPTWSFWQDPVQWLTCLTSKGLTTVGLLAIGLLIGVILIVGLERRPTPI